MTSDTKGDVSPTLRGESPDTQMFGYKKRQLFHFAVLLTVKSCNARDSFRKNALPTDVGFLKHSSLF